ncbi:MAG: bifunctional diguanylate cyclase/phosphodiesterase [Ilumatobacteraceae bacterium]
MSNATEPAQAHSRIIPASKRWQVRVVVVVAVLLLVGGMLGAVLASQSVVRNDREKSKQALALSSSEVASTLRLAIQREQDLAVSATGFFLGKPYPTNTEFLAWADAIGAMKRYPELLGWGEVVIVTSAQLKAYEAIAAADPAGVVSGPFTLVPPGERPFYCLFLVGQSRNPGTNGAPAGFDYCAGAAGEPIIAARDSGLSSYQAVDTGTAIGASLAVQVPFYRGGTTPSTVEARRADFAGWVGLAFDPKIVIDLALSHNSATAVTLRFHDSLSDAEFTSGTVPHGAVSALSDLGNGWTVETFVAGHDFGMFSDRGALLVLMGIAATSLLFAALVLVLGTGRARALQLVGERTGELRHQALHDALTGLPNRALIMDRIDQLLARNRRGGTVGSALYIDLDDFKNVNDTLGHEAGDRLLIAVAERLTSALRDADTIGRMGGDEFVVLIDGASLEVAPELVAQRLLNVMRQPFELDGAVMPLSVNTSIGIAIGDRPTGGELLRDADVALYQAKSAGKNRYEVFFPEMQTEISRRIDLEFELRSAMDGNQFRLVYQPIYRLDDLSLVGVEALLRWDNPSHGLVEPEEFIPILEQNGQINEVGRWVLRQACAQMAEWHSKGDTLDISVNVSGRQLDRDDIIEQVRLALELTGLDPGSLIIEVTETSLMHNAMATARRLKEIKKLGVKIAVDDFGTGYSSLAYLQQFPVDCLKIDGSFTHAISTSPESKALIRTLVQLGKDLGLTTLAEGVETTGEMDHLRSENVNEAQGFLLSRPLDPITLEEQILAPSRPSAKAGQEWVRP